MQNLTQPKIVFKNTQNRMTDKVKRGPRKNSNLLDSAWNFPSMRLLSESLEIEIPNCPQQMVEENDTFSSIFISLSSNAITTVLCHYFENFYKEEPHSHRFVNNVF